MEIMGGMGINSIEALRGNRLMLRGVGLTEKELCHSGRGPRRRVSGNNDPDPPEKQRRCDSSWIFKQRVWITGRLNEAIRRCRADHAASTGCLGQRFIGAGLSETPGGDRRHPRQRPGRVSGRCGSLTVNGNAQDAVGDTMNGGSIVVRGSVGDTAGYAMRGGEIYVQGNAGYRAGIHMKAYQDQQPVIVIGGRAGSFLGEYQAGGIDPGAGTAYGRKARRRLFPLHGTARRARNFQRRCFRHPLPGSGDAPSPHGGGDRPSAAAGGALVRPVRRRRGSADGRALHRGDAGQQKPVPADVRGQLTFLIIFMRRCAGGAEHAEVRTDLRGQSKKSIQNR